MCVWTKICRPRTVLRSEVRTGTRDWDLGAEKLLTYLRAALLAARRATAVVVFSYLDGRLSSRGVPRQLIYTGFCARLHATRSEHQSTYCQCHSLWDTRTAPARLPRSGHSNAISVVRWSRLGPAAAPCTKRYLATEHNCLPSQRTVVGKHACLPPAPPPPPSSVQ